MIYLDNKIIYDIKSNELTEQPYVGACVCVAFNQNVWIRWKSYSEMELAKTKRLKLTNRQLAMKIIFRENLGP